MNKVLQLQENIKAHLQSIVNDLGYGDESFIPHIEEPKDRSNGDLSTNCAMQLARVARKAPRMIAEEIVSRFEKEQYYIEQIEVAGPGFINFHLNKNYLTLIINDVLETKDNFGRSTEARGSVNVEFVSANPTGDLHLGHARGAAVGDALCRILEFAGYDVTREYYINDAGNQIHTLALSTIARYEQQLGLDSELPEDGYHGEDIIDIAKSLVELYGDQYKEESEERYQLFREYAKNYELEKIKQDLKDFRVEFDIWSSEQKLYDDNKVYDAIHQLEAKGYLYEKDGATWFRSTAFGDDKDRVMKKSDGTLTYLTPDISYHIDKLNRGYDKLINIFGADHHGYVPRLKAAIQCLTGEDDKLEVLIIQMVRLIKNGEEYKMSKRSGKAITLRELMGEIGVDPMRYFFAMRSSDSQMDFDIDLATSKSNENPVYYAQYAHARICSILKQAKEKGIEITSRSSYERIDSEKAFEVLKQVANFSKVVLDAAQKRAPHLVTNYIQDLASAFHSFYNAERVITDDIEKSQEMLALVEATRITLANALHLIGVTAPVEM